MYCILWYVINAVPINSSTQTQPFTSILPDAVFNTARFIILQTCSDSPPKMSKVYPKHFTIKDSEYSAKDICNYN